VPNPARLARQVRPRRHLIASFWWGSMREMSPYGEMPWHDTTKPCCTASVFTRGIRRLSCSGDGPS